MRKMGLSLLGLCQLGLSQLVLTGILTLQPTNAWAEMRPVLIVTVSSVEGLLSDVNYIAEATGNEQYGQMAGAIAQGYIQGLDETRPIAIVVQSDGQEVKPLGMLPIKDLKQFLAGLSQQLGEPQDAGDGVLELAGPVPMFVKEQNGWAYLAQYADDLKSLPADPAEMMGGMQKKYDVGIHGFIQNIPQVYRDMALAQIKEGVQAQMDMMPDDGDDSELQRAMVENQIRQWEAILNEVDQVQLGWSTDQENNRLAFDTRVVAISGTRTARQMAAIRDAKTSFGGFYDNDAAVSLRTSGRLQQQDIDQALSMMPPLKQKLMSEIAESDELPNDESREVAKRLANSLFEMLTATLQEGITDGAVSVDFADGSPHLVAGMHVAEGGKLEESLKEIGKLASSNPEFPKMEFNIDQHAGVRFHKVSLPIDEDEEKERAMFGDAVELTIGVSQESVYFSLGDDGVAQVRKSMDASQKDQSVKPAEMFAALGPIMKFAAKYSDEPEISAIADELSSAGETDRFVMTVDPIENGAEYHFELREGILRAIGAGVRAKQAEAVGAGG